MSESKREREVRLLRAAITFLHFSPDELAEVAVMAKEADMRPMRKAASRILEKRIRKLDTESE